LGRYDSLFQSAKLPTTPAIDSPGLFSRVTHGLGSILGAPKAAEDWLTRQAAEKLYGLDVPEDFTTGQLVREAAGLSTDPASGQAGNAESYGARLGGKALEFGVDLATDPLVQFMGLGGLAKAPALQKGATAAFTGLMGTGALEEGLHAAELINQGGFTPEAAESTLGALLSGGGAVLGARHLLKPRGTLETQSTLESDLDAAVRRNQPSVTPMEPEGYIQPGGDWYGHVQAEIPETPKLTVDQPIPEMGAAPEWYGRGVAPAPIVERPVPITEAATPPELAGAADWYGKMPAPQPEAQQFSIPPERLPVEEPIKPTVELQKPVEVAQAAEVAPTEIAREFTPEVEAQARALADLGWKPEEIQSFSPELIDRIIADKMPSGTLPDQWKTYATNLGGSAQTVPTELLVRQEAARAQGIPEDHPWFPREGGVAPPLQAETITPTTELSAPIATEPVKVAELAPEPARPPIEAAPEAKPIPVEPAPGMAEAARQLEGELGGVKPIADEIIPGAKAARERIRQSAERLGKDSPSLGVDPQLLSDYARVGADFIARGARDFAQWSGRMIQAFGESIKQHLSDLWNKAQELHASFTKWKDTTYGPAEQGAIKFGGPSKPPQLPEPPIEPAPVAPKGGPKTPPKQAPAAAVPEPGLAAKPTAMDKVIEGYKGGLLSAFGTWGPIGGNMIGNLGEQAARMAESGIASRLDPLLGGPRVRFKGEASREGVGLIKGLGDGFTTWLKDMKDALTLAPEKLDPTQPAEAQTRAIGGTTGKVFRGSFRLLQAGDRYTRTFGGTGELYKRAWRMAGGNEARFRDLVDNPPESLRKAVERVVPYRSFQNPHELAKVAEAFRKQWKVAHFVIPFANAPANIMQAIVDRSPWGFGKGFEAFTRYKIAVKAGKSASELADLKGEALDSLAKPILGTAILSSMALAAKAGYLTGSGPTDPKEIALKKQTGWQPYSIVVSLGDGKVGYVPFNRFEPISAFLGFAADMTEAKDAKTAEDLFEKGFGSIVQNLTSKTWLQGLADAAEVWSNPDKASQYIAQLAGSAVPNIVRKAAQAVDPVARETKPEEAGISGLPERMARSVAAGIPGLSTTLNPRRTGTGKAIERPGGATVAGAMMRFLSPIQATASRPGTELEAIMAEVSAFHTPPQRDMAFQGSRGKRVRLTDTDMELLTKADQEASVKLRRASVNPNFKALDPEDKRAYILKTYEEYRRKARLKIRSKPDFRRRAREVMRGA